jgi:sulfite reductase (NADPH) flavoprotein alpha-component
MYKNIWFKLHLILGLSAGFILLIVGFTGAILSFEKEILNLINKDTFKVVAQEQGKLSTKELLEKFQEQKPQSKINSITFSSSNDNSSMINVAGVGENARKGVTYYVNPYTAEILPEVSGQNFFKTVESIHRRLLLDDFGKQIVGISVICLLFLMFSGIYIYYPRLKKSFLQSLKLNFQSKGRFFLSNLHSVIGMWVIPFYLVASLTGLYWSYDWFSDSLHQITGVEKTKKHMHHSQEKNNQQNEMKTLQIVEKKSFDDVSFAVDTFNTLIENKYSTATLKLEPKGTVYSFSYLSNSHHDHSKNTFELDIKTKEIVKHDKFEDKTLIQKLMGSILPLHTGEYFGVVGQTLMFLASLMMPLFTVTGLILYIKRRKKNIIKE